MEEKENNGKNILIGVLVVLLGISVVYICYEKFFKEVDEIKCPEEKPSSPTDNDIKENNYEIFKENIIANRKKYYDNTKEKYLYAGISGIDFTVNGDLYYTGQEGTSKELIASNVLNFEFVHSGNGGRKYLYFIKEDGTVSSAGYFMDNQNDTVKKDTNSQVINNIGNYKNIVDIIEVGFEDKTVPVDGGGPSIVFIDINGNMYNQNMN